MVQINRRNVLVGMGALVAGGGAALGTGAFSSVEAQRTVNVSTAGDDTGLIGISVTGDLAGSEDEMISFDLDGDLNLNGVTEFHDVLTITNNRENEGDTVDIDILDDTTSLVTEDSAVDEEGGMQFVVDADGDRNGLDGGGTGEVTFDVVFGLVGETTTGGADGLIPNEVTIEATDASAA